MKERFCWMESKSCQGKLIPMAYVETPTKKFVDICEGHIKNLGISGELIRMADVHPAS